MTADIELLPLPRTLQHADDADLATHVQDYARANVAHATAAKDAEIEALRVRADAMAGEAIKHEARAERLAEALHKLEDSCEDSDGVQYGTLATSFVRGICRDALRDHDGGAE